MTQKGDLPLLVLVVSPSKRHMIYKLLIVVNQNYFFLVMADSGGKAWERALPAFSRSQA